MSEVEPARRNVGTETTWAVAQRFVVTGDAGTPALDVDGTLFLIGQPLAISTIAGEELSPSAPGNVAHNDDGCLPTRQ